MIMNEKYDEVEKTVETLIQQVIDERMARLIWEAESIGARAVATFWREQWKMAFQLSIKLQQKK